jgi:uncharacterized protein (DUF58 family)
MLPPEILKYVRRLQWRSRRVVQGVLGGVYHSVFRGTGLTFEEVREYQPGDDIRMIDWNVTARTGTPFVKRYVEDRERTLILLVDLSASVFFGTQTRTKLQVGAELAALLVLSAVANHDRVGLITFTDRVERCFRPAKGLRHALTLIRSILFPEPIGRGTQLAPALDFLNKVQQRRAVVFVLSDFFDEGFDKPLQIAARRHDLTLIRLRDPVETRPLPPGLYWLEDAESGEQRLIDMRSSAVRVEFARCVQANLGAFPKGRLRPFHVIDVSTEGGHIDVLIRYFRRRQQQGSRPR